MPIYEYQCAKCGHKTEALQKFSDPPISECETCRGKMKKLISHNTFHLKGTGWYVTDYASRSGGNQGYNAKSDTQASSAKSETSAESSTKKNASSKGSTETSNKKVS